MMANPPQPRFDHTNKLWKCKRRLRGGLCIVAYGTSAKFALENWNKELYRRTGRDLDSYLASIRDPLLQSSPHFKVNQSLPDSDAPPWLVGQWSCSSVVGYTGDGKTVDEAHKDYMRRMNEPSTTLTGIIDYDFDTWKTGYQ
jgi:hypothetical protein